MFKKIITRQKNIPHLYRWRVQIGFSVGENISSLVETRRGKEIFLQPKNFLMIRSVIIYIIKVYQKRISPFKKPSCRFYPTCSQYAIDAVNRYGALKGSFMATKRILKCNPFHSGGYDPVK